MADFNEIYTNITNVNVAANAGIAFSKLAALPSAQILVGSAGNVATAVTMSGDATISNTGVVTVAGGGIVPIGTILPFYDYNYTLTFDNTKYAYCDGSIVNFTGIGPQTTPDLSGRYLIGFGTPGGNDMNTCPGPGCWATAAVGNAASTINILHSHTVNNHTHDLANHTHDLSNHTHTGGLHTHTLSDSSYAFIAMPAQGGSSTTEICYRTIATPDWNTDDRCDSVQDQSSATTRNAGVPLGGATDSDGAVATGAPSTNTSGAPSTNTSGGATPGTDNQLSAAQDIRPSSIRVRYIIRYA